MSISDKIGTSTVVVKAGGPNYDLIEQVTSKRAPLTPDLFPYYAGSLDDPDGYYDERGFYIEQLVPYEQEEQIGDYDEIYQDELEILNHPSFEDVEKISKLVDEVEATTDISEAEFQSKLNELDNEINDTHSNIFNDIKLDDKKEIEKELTISFSEEVKPVKLEVNKEVSQKPSETPIIIEVSQEAPKTNNLPPVPPPAPSIKPKQDEKSKYAAKFTVDAKAKDEYYEDVLEKNDELNKKN